MNASFKACLNNCLNNWTNHFLFSCDYIFKREIRNEPVSMPLVNGQIFIQNFFFPF